MTRTIAAVVLSLGLAACTSTGSGRQLSLSAVAKVCDTFATITYDGKLDTKLTKEQIKQYNAKRKAFCETSAK